MTPDINRIFALPANKACSYRGADMGRMSQREGKPERLYLQRVRLTDGGCYDAGGAYWGNPSNLWCAFSNPTTTQNEFPIRVFVRAATRNEAKQGILSQLNGEGWNFYR